MCFFFLCKGIKIRINILILIVANISRLCSQLFTKSKGCCNIKKEVMVKRFRDSNKKLRINACASKYFIHIGTVARYFSCQPCRSSLLAAKFLFYHFTNMHKKRRNCLLLIPTLVPPRTLNTDKPQKQFTPFTV